MIPSLLALDHSLSSQGLAKLPSPTDSFTFMLILKFAPPRVYHFIYGFEFTCFLFISGLSFPHG